MKNKLTYFLTRSSMFGIGYFLIFKHAGKDAWIAIILGTIYIFIILSLFSYNYFDTFTNVCKFFLFIIYP